MTADTLTTKEYLKKYREYRDLASYYNRTIAAQVRTGRPVSGHDLAARNHYEDIVSRIENAINQVTDPTEQLLLRLRYIDCWSWTKICFAIHYSRSQAKRIHAKALGHLEQQGLWTE